MTTVQSGYYAPLTVTRSATYKAWTVQIGTTPDGKWVAEYKSIAAPRYERQYFGSEYEAVKAAAWILNP